MDEEIKTTLYLIVDMIDTLGKKVDRLDVRMDRLEERMDRMENDIKEFNEGQKRINERLDTQAIMYGPHEEAIRRLKAMKII